MQSQNSSSYLDYVPWFIVGTYVAILYYSFKNTTVFVYYFLGLTVPLFATYVGYLCGLQLLGNQQVKDEQFFGIALYCIFLLPMTIVYLLRAHPKEHVYIKLKRLKKKTTFYHFILGEFLPVLDIILRHNFHDREIFITNTHPKLERFRHFYSELPFHIKFIFEVPSDKPFYEIKRLDKPSLKFANRPETMSGEYEMPSTKLKRVVTWLKDYAGCLNNQAVVIFQKRDADGIKSRSVENLGIAYEQFKEAYPNVACEFSVPGRQKPLLAQIREYSCAKLIIGEHGAGLLHAFWSAPGCKVIEIGSKAKLARRYFSRMSDCLGYNVVEFEVEDSDGYPKVYTVRVEALLKEIDRIMKQIL